MPRRESYNDLFSGSPDEGIRLALENDSSDENRNIRKVLLKVINNELTTRQRDIIMLYYYKGLNTSEIAERMNVTPQAVCGVLSRARLRVFRILRYYL